MHATIHWTLLMKLLLRPTTVQSGNLDNFLLFHTKRKVLQSNCVIGQSWTDMSTISTGPRFYTQCILKVSFRQICGKWFPCKDKHFYIPLRGHANSLFAFQRWMAAKCLVALWGSKCAKTSSRPCDLLMTWQEGKHTSASFKLALYTGSHLLFARHCHLLLLAGRHSSTSCLISGLAGCLFTRHFWRSLTLCCKSLLMVEAP